MVKKGIFITVDGPDGCGKSTNAGELCGYLKSKGYSVLHTHEPGGTVTAEKIRGILLDPGNRISPVTELFLYEASRAQHVKEVILPALLNGMTVVCERFYDATTAYQGYGRGLNIKMIEKLNEVAVNGVIPDISIILDVDVKKALKKAVAVSKDYKEGVADRLEGEDIEFHKKVRKGFLLIAKSEPRRVKVVEVKERVEDTQEAIRVEVEKILRKQG